MATATDVELIKCASCGATNRVSVEPNDNREPICGRCKAPLNAQPHPFTATDANFAAEVQQSALPVLVDFWAPWCPPCRAIAPAIDQLAGEFAGRARIAKLNIDENQRTAAKFGVRSIPTMIVMKDGKEVDRIVGALPKQQISARLSRWVV
ncbi:MAG TPA: thioredoxin TrxC [Blastocatellia bacterium]|nr:thioredoxin TrxC [Blastocatellia bacterium]